MPRLYAYPVTLSRSDYRARRSSTTLVTREIREVYTNGRRFSSRPRRATPRHATPRFPFIAPRSSACLPHPARLSPLASREGARCRRARREVPFAVQLHVPFARDRLASLVPVRADFFILPFPFSFLSPSFFPPPISFPSRGLVFVRLTKCPQMPITLWDLVPV